MNQIDGHSREGFECLTSNSVLSLLGLFKSLGINEEEVNNPRWGIMVAHRVFDHMGEDCAEVLNKCQVQRGQFYPDQSITVCIIALTPSPGLTRTRHSTVHSK